MLIAVYMGSRAGVICSASIAKMRPGTGAWIDLNSGFFYGQGVTERETNKRKQMGRVPPKLLAHLRRWQRKGQQYAVEWNGRPIQRITKAHDAVVLAAGISADVTPHVWRHTAVTWAMQNGGDRWDIANFFGMTVETLERVYGKFHPDHSARTHKSLG